MSQQSPLKIGDVLFATDFSAASEAAFRLAHAYARQLGARLHLLHVVPQKAATEPVPQIQELAGRLGVEVPIVTAVESGAPAVEIVRYAERHGVGLIIVGTHGRTGVTRALLGSVAERVARTAPCPVLTVPQGFAMQGEAVPVPASTPPPPLERCLVCATPSRDLICEPCRARIRGEAVERKLSEMRSGKP